MCCCDFTENSVSPGGGDGTTPDQQQHPSNPGSPTVTHSTQVTFNAQAEVINEDHHQAVPEDPTAAPEAAALGDSSAAAPAVDTAALPAAASAAESAESAPHLNLPAVLWDRPAGSKTKVPPPVPPRSPRKPIEASGAFEAALSREAAAAAAAASGAAAAAVPPPAASVPIATRQPASSAGGPSRGWSSLPTLHFISASFAYHSHASTLVFLSFPPLVWMTF